RGCFRWLLPERSGHSDPAHKAPEARGPRKRAPRSRSEPQPKGLHREPEPRCGRTPSGVEGFSQFFVERLVAAEKEILQEALAVFDALRQQNFELPGIERRPLAREKDVSLLLAHSGEGGAIPLVDKPAVQRISQWFVVGEHKEAAGIEVSVAAD